MFQTNTFYPSIVHVGGLQRVSQLCNAFTRECLLVLSLLISRAGMLCLCTQAKREGDIFKLYPDTNCSPNFGISSRMFSQFKQSCCRLKQLHREMPLFALCSSERGNQGYGLQQGCRGNRRTEMFSAFVAGGCRVEHLERRGHEG